MTRDRAGEHEMQEHEAGRLRIDRWLWCTRFYKSRSLASAAVTGGKVHVNGERVKPSRALAVGDQLAITRGPDTVELIVRALPERRGPAAQAQRCFEETADSVARRARLREQHALAAASAPRPQSRPDKRQRRLLQRLHRGQS
jgi:ribosome-associated heat shock protein Hsp15